MTTARESDAQRGPPRSWVRVLVAVVMGLAGSLVLWVAAPYNNFVMRSHFIVDDNMPVGVVFLVLVLVLAVNPLLRRFMPRLALTSWQLAMVFGIWLVAAVAPSSGLLRQLPYAIAQVPLDVRESADLADAYHKMNLPSSLFPDKLGYQADTPVAEYFIRDLPKGASVPWGAWVPPLLAWGSLVVFSWLMMVGLGMIVLPQWQRNERLSFPLQALERSMIEDPGEGEFFAPLFRRRGFWIAAGAVFLLHFLVGMKLYYPDSVPAVPLRWDLTSVFQDSILRHLPGHIRSSRIYFMFLGMTFFMPTRIGFSIWFFELAYALYVVIGTEYAPPFYYATMYEHRTGALFPVALFVLWLGRKHWAHVFRCIFFAQTDEERRNRSAALMFSAGCIGMYFWMLWAGVRPLWAAFYVGFGFVVSIIVTRIVAETGMPFVRIDVRYTVSMVKLAPMAWLNMVSLYFATAITLIFTLTSRVSCSTMTTHALGLDDGATPRHQTRMAWFFLALLVVGLVISGSVHVYMNYHHSMTLDGEEAPLSPWGTTRISEKGHPDMLAWNAGRLDRPVYNQFGHLCFGAGLAAGLEWACLSMPKWPFHPVGLIMVGTFYANEAWASILFGWLAKVLLVGYGGARLYRAARPVFFGIIMGEVFAAVFWSLEPAVRVALGLPYKIVEVLPK